MSAGDWFACVFPLGIALAILWDGQRRPNAFRMAVGWAIAEINGAAAFQAGLRWSAIAGVFVVAFACLPGLLRVLAAPFRTDAGSPKLFPEGIDRERIT